MTTFPTPSYNMGFKINNTAIPDPSEFSCNESDLDTMGERDATGYLHRNMVARKYNMKIAWSGIPWSIITTLGGLSRGPKFTFTFPNPFNGGTLTTIDAYAGDRSMTDKWSPVNELWLGDISFSVIQY